jgi:hypothetical protein
MVHIYEAMRSERSKILTRYMGYLHLLAKCWV